MEYPAFRAPPDAHTHPVGIQSRIGIGIGLAAIAFVAILYFN